MEYTRGKLKACHHPYPHPGMWIVKSSDDPNLILRSVQKTALTREVSRRLVDCWNACEGIEDPVKAIPALIEACQMAQKLIEDMIRFVGQMALQDYALLNETPIKLNQALSEAKGE